MTNILDIFNFAPFLMWNDHNNKYTDKIVLSNKMDINNNIIKNNDDITNDNINIMKEVFFMKDNIDIIQYRIIMSIYCKSNKKLRIKEIKNEILVQIMNYIWSTCCKFLPYNFKEQINDLDNKVVNYCVPLLLKEAEFYFNYLRDIDRNNRQLLDRPIMVYNNKK